MHNITITKIILLNLFLLFSFISGAQVNIMPSSGNTAINVPSGTTPGTNLSVNTTGDSRWSIHSLNPTLVDGATAVFGETTPPNNASASKFYGVRGLVNSGFGWTYGVRGDATNTTASTAGRAYGVFGAAGNATAGTNFGVYATLKGINGGTALLAWDEINHFNDWNTILPNPNKTWAGFLLGDVGITGNAGIGSTNPLSRLSVNGDGSSDWSAYFHTNSATNGSRAIYAEADQPIGFSDHVRAISANIDAGMGFTYGIQGSASASSPSSGGRAYGVYGQAADATPGANYGVFGRLYGSNDGTAILGIDDVNFSDLNAVLLTDTWAGYFIGNTHVTNKVGIGCTNLNYSSGTSVIYKLFVDGGIIGRELSINNGTWCDYVFDTDYNLLSIEEVEAHIETKGHLHNTPSAKEIEEQGGFEVGEITRNQQEKIEEIYLHLIEMNKRIKDLEQENKTLKTIVANQTK